MGFIFCQIKPVEDGLMSVHGVRALALGGKKGLLARHLPAMAKSGDGNWSLTAHELLKLENDDVPDDACILFDLAPRAVGQKNLLCLIDVCGRTMSLLTDALFHFKVLAPIEAGGLPDSFTVKSPRNGTDCYEQMRLEGGFLGGSWSWTEPPLALGATVLHPFST